MVASSVIKPRTSSEDILQSTDQDLLKSDPSDASECKKTDITDKSSDNHIFLASCYTKTEEQKKILVYRGHFETAFDKVKPSVSGSVSYLFSKISSYKYV